MKVLNTYDQRWLLTSFLTDLLFLSQNSSGFTQSFFTVKASNTARPFFLHKASLGGGFETSIRSGNKAHSSSSVIPLSTATDPNVLRGDPEWRKFAPDFVFRTLYDVRDAELDKQAQTGTWESRRYLIREDGFGFSFHHTILKSGHSTMIHYKNHVEGVFVFSGSGEIELCKEGQKEGEGFVVLELKPGTFYGLGGQERHFLRASKDGDMHVACAFNPPVDGAEDHDASGVYPAIGADGVKRFEYDEQAVPLLFKPPRTLANGSGKTKGRSQPDSLNMPASPPSGVIIRRVARGDGKLMWSLAKDCGLDLNSAYMYNLFCLQFSETCKIAIDEETNEDVGFLLGYIPPQNQDTLFVWQIGVVAKARKQGIGMLMLETVSADVGASFLQATVTEANEASNRLFQNFAKRKNCALKVEKNWVAEDDFPDTDLHPSECLYTIGPFEAKGKESKPVGLDGLSLSNEVEHTNLEHLHHDPTLYQLTKKESNARSYVRRFPFVVKKAEGCVLTDTKGKSYLDFLAGAGALPLGHNHPVQNQAIKYHIQAKQPLQSLDLATTAKAEFVEELFHFLPERFRTDYRVQFCATSGSDAVDAAVKLSKIATGRNNVLAFHGAYHGMGQGPLALMGSLTAREVPGLQTGGVHFLPFPNSYRHPFGLSTVAGGDGDRAVLHYIEHLLDDCHSGVDKPACLVMEVLQGEGGLNCISDWALQELSRIMRERSIPLVVDEVQSGFCRTGQKFAFEYSGITPDVIVLSKAVGGSQPLSCVVYHKDLDQWGPGMHAGTFRGNGLAFSSGAATLKYMQEEKLWEKARMMGDLFRESILARKSPFIADMRGLGLMIGLELGVPSNCVEADHPACPPKPSGDLAAQTQLECLKRGLMVERGGRDGAVLRPMPPLIVSKEEIQAAASIILEAIEAAAEKIF